MDDKNIRDTIKNENPLEISKEEFEYGENLKGFLAKSQNSKIGIVLIHEWFGLSEYIKTLAELIAENGYTVLALDLYAGSVAKTPEEAKELRGKLEDEKVLQNISSAVLAMREKLKCEKVATLGFCLGGKYSLEYNVNSNDNKADATLIYYGRLEIDFAKLSKLSGPVFAIFGGEDEYITIDKVKEFEENLKNFEIKHEVYIYEGAGHAFMNPGNENFSEEIAEDAWDKMIHFLRKNLSN